MAVYRNSLKNKKAIQKAFADLLLEKNDINKITVKEIVERADISKSTFYAHYQDIYAVEEELEIEVINFLKENEDIYKKIINSNYQIRFIDELKDMCNEAVNNDVRINFLSKDEKKRKAEIDFITNGTIHLFVDYFKGKIPQTLDEIGEGIASVMNIMCHSIN